MPRNIIYQEVMDYKAAADWNTEYQRDHFNDYIYVDKTQYIIDMRLEV